MGLSGSEPRRLTAAARPAVLDHLLALAGDDRYGRFSTALSDEGIVAYVRRIDFHRDRCFAIDEPAGGLSGFIHLAISGEVAELGASVAAPFRRLGRARCLFASALADARLAGLREIHLVAGHPAARHICRQLGYELVCGYGAPRVRVLLGSGREEEKTWPPCTIPTVNRKFCPN